MRDEGDNAGEMNPGSNTESYPAFAHIGLRENPGKNLNQVTYPDRESNPGNLVSRLDSLTVIPQMGSACSTYGESRNAYRVLVGRPEEKDLWGGRDVDGRIILKMDLREVGYDDRDWINLAQDRDRWRAYVRAAMNLRVPYLILQTDVIIVNGVQHLQKIYESARVKKTTMDITLKIVKFNKSMGIINRVLKPSIVQKSTRTLGYQTIARPVLCYGSEVWTITTKDESRLTACEMR
ncbi:hypothetical protein ANN_18067 [Periplaneta americana]|uniref:Uncharacterized protein n=1 Tax=Periplaneta americana TaxID=6978 RepID=A0ABQ8SP29_PERAM|nr:hypothetical protein ANN_18067 [Periplaneta americana]